MLAFDRRGGDFRDMHDGGFNPAHGPLVAEG
jgi:hypothetical protein